MSDLQLTNRCAVCATERPDWPRDRVIAGELTRGDINMIRAEHDMDPICSKSCMHERYREHCDLLGADDLQVAARFGGPGYRER